MITIDRAQKKPLYQQLYEQLCYEIVSGRLKEGTILTGTREMANILQISRNTVSNAYLQLYSEGYLISKKGIGYVVAALPTDFKKKGSFFSKNRTETVFSPELSEKKSASIRYDLTNSSHTCDLFPKKLWRKYTLEGLDHLEQEEKLSAYQDRQGEFYLRHQLYLYLARIRGVHCKEDQIIITCGLQQSLDFISKLFGKTRPSILMEEPGYNKACAVFAANGLSVQTVPVDEQGLITTTLPLSRDICAVYTTPSHQFPTGSILPVTRRYALINWAVSNDSYILEDDYDSELRYYAKPVPSLQSIDQKERVIYLGTFSKGLSPSIRMGYMILPRHLLASYHNLFENYNCTAPLLNQYVIGRLLETGQYERHMRKMNHVFKKRLEMFQEGFADLKEKVRITSNGSGQYFLLSFTESVHQEELIRAAIKEGVMVYSTMQFWQDQASCPPDTLFLGFSKIDISDIPDCISRLKRAWKKWL